ncbi:hypothetical protein [Luteimonas abyssi]|uniref:hypothetical protein n=1 Tax=Luteimonas abyssi TaxID=1247514 RepID=UPI000737CF78|nr:hypothetical protein [Luteimonas abyssi]
MSAPDKIQAAKAAPATTPDRPGRSFAPRKGREGATLTHERLAEDMAAFRKAGGEIEVLGVTRTLQRIDLPADAAPPAPTTPPRR